MDQDENADPNMTVLLRIISADNYDDVMGSHLMPMFQKITFVQGLFRVC